MSNRIASILTDEEIVAMYWARDEQAIKQTDIKYHSILINVALNILQNKEDSEECLNDTYIGAWNSMPPHKPSVLRSFLSGIMRKIAISKFRANHRQKRQLGQAFSLSDFEDFIPCEDDPYTVAQARALGQVIGTWLERQSQRRRYIFISRYYYAKPIEQITAELGCSKSTVNKEIAQLKQSLREMLAKEGYGI